MNCPTVRSWITFCTGRDASSTRFPSSLGTIWPEDVVLGQQILHRLEPAHRGQILAPERHRLSHHHVPAGEPLGRGDSGGHPASQVEVLEEGASAPLPDPADEVGDEADLWVLEAGRDLGEVARARPGRSSRR